MTEHEQWIALAEFDEYVPLRGLSGLSWTKNGRLTIPPDYLNDLNAMHDVEQRLSPNQLDDYRFHLMELTCKQPRWRIEKDIALAIVGSAELRAEALLRTIGKWKD